MYWSKLDSIESDFCDIVFYFFWLVVVHLVLFLIFD